MCITPASTSFLQKVSLAMTVCFIFITFKYIPDCTRLESQHFLIKDEDHRCQQKVEGRHQPMAKIFMIKRYVMEMKSAE